MDALRGDCVSGVVSCADNGAPAAQTQPVGIQDGHPGVGLLANIFNGMQEACFALDPQWRFILINDRFQILLDLHRETILHKTLWEVFPHLVGTPVEQYYRKAMAQRTSICFEAHSPRINRWIEVRIFPSGEGLAAFVLDVNDRKRIESERLSYEQRLRDTEARLRSTLDRLMEGCQILDREWRYIYLNEAAALHGRTRAEAVLGRTIMECFPNFENTPVFATLRRCMEQRESASLESVYQFTDGWESVFQLNVQPVPEGLLILSLDITERKRAADALRRSEEQFRTMVDAIPQLAWMADERGYLFWYNKRWYEFTGTTPEEMIGWGWQKVHDPEMMPKVLESWNASIQNGEPFEMDFPLRSAAGEYRWFMTKAIPLRDSAGHVMRWCGTNTDITLMREAELEKERLNAELERRVAERTAELQAANKELESFSYSVSHDLRAPLRAVDGFAHAILEDYAQLLPEEGQRYLMTIRQSAQSMGLLIDDLLAFSRLGRAPLNKTYVDMDLLVRTALTDFGREQAIRKVTVKIGRLAPCQGDPALLKQVWQNLLSNAFKYTRNRQEPIIEIGSEASPGGTIWFVRDNGTGFDMRYAHKLFGVFQRLHRADEYEGTGVGLALVHRIVSRHGGRVWAQAQLDHGATFSFSLGQE